MPHIRTDMPCMARLRQSGLALLCCSALAACSPQDQDDEAATTVLRPVKVLEISAGSAALERTLSATVISADSQNISFRISGSITSLPIAVGDSLKAGALVATLDQETLKLREKEARAQLAQAEADYRNAQGQYQRARELYATEAASLSDLENAKARASSASANRSLAEEGVNSTKLNLGYSQLRSPAYSCQVVDVPVAVNENINAGQTITTLACGDELRLRTIAPESLINRINRGMPVTATLQSGNTTLAGRVIEVAVSNRNSAGYPVEIKLESPPATIKAGMTAQVTFKLAHNEKRLLVPLIAVMSDHSEKFVYIAAPEGEHYRIVRRTVQTGELDNNGIEILHGLMPGQRVVVAGMSRISEGMNVTLYDGAGP